jgi:ABC-type Zn uptake system ZnuABC Zn-binding protein ZnuA
MTTRHTVGAGIPLLFVAAFLAGCGSPPGGPASSGRPQVVATFSVLDDFVRNVAGDKVDLVTLVGPDGDAHTFNPAPQDIAAVGRAAVVFEVGAGFETDWFDKAFAASGSKAKRVAVADGLELEEGECHHKPGDKLEPGHAHELDPHVWHEVTNAVHMVGKVRDGLCEADPANAAAYRANADAYIAKLRDLDAWVVATVNTLPPDRRKLVTSHDTFGYFARRYGFTVVGSVLPSFSTEAADPSAAEFADLVGKVKAQKVLAVFCEASHNSKLVERLAAAAGVQLAPPLYTDALGAKGSPGDTYLGMMRHNVTTIVDALKP